jgi:serine/threonine-protein kinase
MREPTATRSTIPAPPAVPSERRSLLSPGEVLNDTYEIVEMLGEGGMGQVFGANDLPLQRRVAIKTALPDTAQALRLEARALAAVRHPAIVSIFALGKHRDLEYIVMERIYGLTLDQHIEARQQGGRHFAIDEALGILTAVADGLGAVHRAGLSHRDLKPSNIVLAVGNRVVLIDFGLVALDADRERHGPEALVRGSPGYMAPEVIGGCVAFASAHLVDLYALGVVAFELVTGVLPFGGESVGDVLRKHVDEVPPSILDLRPEAPPALARLVGQLLEKAPSERPQSADEVLWQLQSIRERGEGRARAERLGVLIADDDELVREVLSTFVREIVPRAEIRTAANGAAAIDAVVANPPRVLLLDLHMPDMNGVEVCMYLRGVPLAQRCKVISISGGAEEQDVALLRQLGVVAFLPKGPKLHAELGPLLHSLLRT